MKMVGISSSKPMIMQYITNKYNINDVFKKILKRNKSLNISVDYTNLNIIQYIRRCYLIKMQLCYPFYAVILLIETYVHISSMRFRYSLNFIKIELMEARKDIK